MGFESMEITYRIAGPTLVLYVLTQVAGPPQ